MNVTLLSSPRGKKLNKILKTMRVINPVSYLCYMDICNEISKQTYSDCQGNKELGHMNCQSSELAHRMTQH